MNGLTRIHYTFSFKETDRVAIFEQSAFGSVVSEIIGRPALGFATDLHFEEAKARSRGKNALEDFLENWKDDYTDFVNAIDMDMVTPPWLLWKTPSRQIDEFTFSYRDNEGEIVRRFDSASQTFSVVSRSPRNDDPERLIKRIQEMTNETDVDPFPEEYYDLLSWMRDAFGKNRCVAGGGFLGIPMEPEWMILMMTDKGAIRNYLEIMAEREIVGMKRQSSLGATVINGGGDLATSRGPFYSPELFREIVLPSLKKVITACHEFGMKYIYRTDGDIRPMEKLLLDDSGTDAFGEIDIDAGMDFPTLRKNHPKLVLCGGLSCGSLLLNGTVEDIINETKRLKSELGNSGGWIFGSSNTLLPGTNVEGYMAAREELQL